MPSTSTITLSYRDAEGGTHAKRYHAEHGRMPAALCMVLNYLHASGITYRIVWRGATC